MDYLSNGPDPADRSGIRAEYAQLSTVCSGACQLFSSTVIDLVRLAIRCITSVTENESSIAKITELEGTIRDIEQYIKDVKGRVKIAEDVFHTVFQTAREHPNRSRDIEGAIGGCEECATGG